MAATLDPVHLAIIVGSTRVGRKSDAVARWAAQAADRRGDLTVDVVDLSAHPLPHFDEPVPPIVGEYQHPHTIAWANVIAGFDGFIFVAPEYNHSMPGVLKNAIDHLYGEWNDKVASFITYGGDGGVRAAEHLRVVLGELRVADVRRQVALSLRHDFVGYEDFAPREEHEETLDAMFDELVSWGRALRDVRHARSEPPAALDAIIIRTRVKASERARYRAQLDAVYDDLRASRPSNYRSLTFQIGDDDAEYLDVAVGPELPGPVGELASFQDFRTGLEDRCDARTADTVELLHAYGIG